VSGVVNFIFDKKFEGFKMNLNGAISNYADDPQAQIQLAAGTSFAGGRGHIEVSGEFTSEAGVNSVTGPRKWYQNPQTLNQFTAAQCQPNGCPGGSPMNINGLNGKFTQFSYGGLITRGPLMGTNFGANGAASQYDYGFGYNGQPAVPQRNAANANVTNCSSGGYCFGGDTSGNQTGYGALVARLVRGNTFARVSYDITPEIEVYATGLYSEVVTWDKPTQSFFKSDNLQVACDNPFLPTGVAQACLANNGQSAGYNSQFTSIVQPAGGIAGNLSNAYAPAAADIASGANGGFVSNGFSTGYTAGKMQYGTQNAILANVENYNNRTTRRFVVGADGVFNLFDTDWSFKAYG
jgi:iron complex outermembrane recepter protein